jgi:hypothetical protein
MDFVGRSRLNPIHSDAKLHSRQRDLPSPSFSSCIISFRLKFAQFDRVIVEISSQHSESKQGAKFDEP